MTAALLGLLVVIAQIDASKAPGLVADERRANAKRAPDPSAHD